MQKFILLTLLAALSINPILNGIGSNLNNEESTSDKSTQKEESVSPSELADTLKKPKKIWRKRVKILAVTVGLLITAGTAKYFFPEETEAFEELAGEWGDYFWTEAGGQAALDYLGTFAHQLFNGTEVVYDDCSPEFDSVDN